MKYNGVSFLFVGDQAFDAEDNLLASGINIKSDILKVGHHGSATSTSAEFIKAVSPQVAIYSAGVGNPYHHPSPDTISRLSASIPNVYGTDKNGTIIVMVNPDGYKITTGKNNGRDPPVNPTPTQAGKVVVPPVSSGSLTIVSVTNPVSKGGNAILTAQTAPGANCTITVYYKSGASKASGLAPKVADGSGVVSWTWKVASNTTAGTWRIVVTSNDGQTDSTQETTFTVK